MKKFIIALCALGMLTACHKDDNEEEKERVERTVLVYMSGECSLYNFVQSDLDEMLTGSKTIGNNALLVYVDKADSSELPWLARIQDGKVTDSVSVADMNITGTDGYPGTAVGTSYDPYASDPKVMESVLRYAYEKYPAKNDDYGLVLWGHGEGWLMKDSITYNAMARRRAYGVDNGRNSTNNNGKWLNTPSMAKLLSRLPKLKFIFFDCCNMMCLENAYELRNVAEYIIGSPAEIPAKGAPYDTVVPAMFEKSTFYTSIVDKYRAGYSVPLSAVKTSEMEDLANATKVVLKSIKAKNSDIFPYPVMSGLIHYYYDYTKKQLFYDANDFVMKYAEEADYNSWKQALDKAVVYKKIAKSWDTNQYWDSFYTDFKMTDAKFGGVSMFVPTYYQQLTDNDDIQQMGWYKAAGYDEIGW